MEALKEETRQKIIDLLLTHGELSLTEIQQRLGKTLPTLLFHVNMLEKAGLVSWKLSKKGRKTTKTYFIRTKLISMDVDIEVFSKAMNLKMLNQLLDSLVEKSASIIGFIPRQYSVSDIVKVLNVDAFTATALKDYLETYEEEFVKKIVDKFSEKINSIEKIDPDTVAKELKIDVYWAAKVLKELKLL